MTFKNFIQCLLVLSFTFFILQSVYAQAAKQKDASVVSVNELSDIHGDEWAYKAIQELVEKYDVLEGYPDGTFKGKKTSTRFELAAAVYDLATYFSDQIALDRDDLAKLAKLLDEFSNDIKAIQGRVEQLETKVTVVEGKTTALEAKTMTLEGQIAQHTAQLQEHEQRLAYAERRKGFLLERFAKGIAVDFRDISRGILTAVTSPFNKKNNLKK